MDLRMPGMDGVSATEKIRAECPQTRVLILTTYDSDRDIDRAVRAGATGYLLKDSPREDLFRAIAATARGESLLAPAVAARLMRRVGERPTEEIEPLTARERAVLSCVARGQRNKEIAAELHISETTVKTHLEHIFGKLGVTDRTAAVTVALQRNLLTL
jgi:DNA-binding NarL/FixJ family response regulator